MGWFVIEGFDEESWNLSTILELMEAKFAQIEKIKLFIVTAKR